MAKIKLQDPLDLNDWDERDICINENDPIQAWLIIRSTASAVWIIVSLNTGKISQESVDQGSVTEFLVANNVTKIIHLDDTAVLTIKESD